METYTCIVGHHDTHDAKAATLPDGMSGAHCCINCAVAHNHPGRFEKWSYTDEETFRENAEEMGKALILHAWMMDGGEDEGMSNEGWGWCGRFDNFLFTIDDRGAVDFEEFENNDAADKKFMELFNEGWGASEDDIYLTHNYRDGWKAFSSYKEIEVALDREGKIGRRRVLAAISLWMREKGYFPNVWEEGERGGITNISQEVW